MTVSNDSKDAEQLGLSHIAGGNAMVKWTMVYPYSGILLSNKKGQIIDTHKMDESQMHYAK